MMILDSPEFFRLREKCSMILLRVDLVSGSIPGIAFPRLFSMERHVALVCMP